MNHSADDDYLWDGSGTPDPFVQSLEDTLACLASPPQLEVGAPEPSKPRRSVPWKELAIASMAAAAVLALLWLSKTPSVFDTEPELNPAGNPESDGSATGGDAEPGPVSPDLEDPFRTDQGVSPDLEDPFRSDGPNGPNVPAQADPADQGDGPDLKNPFEDDGPNGAPDDSTAEKAPKKKGTSKKHKSKPNKKNSNKGNPDLKDPFSDEPEPEPTPLPEPKDPFKSKSEPPSGSPDLEQPFRK